MKIGIVTQPLVNNYGGLLQNYALQEVLRRLGHDPITLDQPMYNPVSAAREGTAWLKARWASIPRILSGRPPIKSKYELRKIRSVQTSWASSFSSSHIKRTNRLYGKAAMRRATEEHGIKTLIAGSDQLWRKGMSPRMEGSFLDFAEGMAIGKVAYAASFGVDEWQFNEAETERLGSLLRSFNAVSVREDSAVRLCREHFGVEASHVLDPTMLLDSSDYLRLIDHKPTGQKAGGIVAYMLDYNPAKQMLVSKLAADVGKSVTLIAPKDLPSEDDASVEEWLWSFANADLAVCDSFHGVVFSIIFNKDFVAISNSARGNTRFQSLLAMFGLHSRLVDESALDGATGIEPIDWAEVNRVLAARRAESMEFICRNIKQP